MITLVFNNNDTNQAFVDSFSSCFSHFIFQYLLEVRKFSRRCALALMSAFSNEDKMAAMDSA